MGTFCKFFGTVPSVIHRELRRLPVGYLDEVMLFQRFAEAWATFSAEEDKDKLPKHPLYDLCMEILAEQWSDRKKNIERREKGE